MPRTQDNPFTQMEFPVIPQVIRAQDEEAIEIVDTLFAGSNSGGGVESILIYRIGPLVHLWASVQNGGGAGTVWRQNTGSYQILLGNYTDIDVNGDFVFMTGQVNYAYPGYTMYLDPTGDATPGVNIEIDDTTPTDADADWSIHCIFMVEDYYANLPGFSV